KLVYLALKGIFQGQDAQIRKKKTILKLIKKYQSLANIRILIQQHSLDSLCQVAKALLEEKVFESTLKAKTRFPDVFEVSPDQSAERAISESAAAKHEDAAIQCVTEGHQGESSGHESGIPSASLYPVYLPFDVQHRILARVQHTLEKAFYIFAQKKLGGILQNEGWDCAEAVELNRWPRVLLVHKEEFDPGALADLRTPLPDLLNSITQLRHATVHRLRLTANRAIQFINDAESLIELVQDDAYVHIISTIRRQTQLTIEELERNKDMLESRLAETRREFATRRAELKRQELEEMENTVNGDREYAIFAGATL
ncbi:uncharacterized protein K460DRAFT_238546, partial [Cucurbitaria berberidis CBS 394.84]